jgi:hypothetical protein
VFLVIDKSDFNEPTLRKVFSHFAREYSEPVALNITAFSDQELMVKQLVRFQWGTDGLLFGSEANERKFHGKYYIPRSGFARANYGRSNQEERFSYNANLNQPEWKSVVMRQHEKAR